MYESNRNSIVDIRRNSYTCFGRAGNCNVWITAPATDPAGEGAKKPANAGFAVALTCFKFRFLKGPLSAVHGDGNDRKQDRSQESFAAQPTRSPMQNPAVNSPYLP
jgi:hypothetical protein